MINQALYLYGDIAMITQRDMLVYLESRGKDGRLLSEKLIEIGENFRVFVCYYAVKDFKADERVVYLSAYVDSYARQMSRKYREDPVEYARYRPAVKQSLSMEFGL
jgi:hypothetical protein